MNNALIHFQGVPPVKRPTGAGPLLQWFNALPTGNGRALATGWHIQANRCSEELTEALKKLKISRQSVLHRMTGEIVEYWSLEACSLVILCNGFADTYEMKSSPDRDGIAYGWIEDKQKSKVKARVFIAELASVGYLEAFTVTLEGMITECFLEALAHQFDVLDAYAKLCGGQQAPFWGFALELAPAEKPRMVGRNGKQSPIIPMVAQVPQTIDEEYLLSHVAPEPLLNTIIERDLISKAIAWSVETSRIISRGEDREAWEGEEYDGALHHQSKHTNGSELEEEPEPMATPQQVKSITNLYRLLGEEAMPEDVLKELTFVEAAAKIKTMNADYKSRKGKK